MSFISIGRLVGKPFTKGQQQGRRLVRDVPKTPILTDLPTLMKREPTPGLTRQRAALLFVRKSFSS